MKKINRRDYLKHMGVAAGALGAARLNLLDPKGRVEGKTYNRTGRVNPGSAESNPPPAASDSWPAESEPPKDVNPGIRLVFAGMVAFTYKKTEARVVFHRESEHHNLKIIVFEQTGDACKEIYRNEDVPKRAIMDLRIKDKTSDARFFEGPGFDRATYQGDDKDFRWLLDFEKPPCNNGKVSRKEDKFNTKMKVRHGVFYTYKHTGSTFLLDDGSGHDTKLGYVPKAMAADIKLVAGECVSFKIKGKQILPKSLCHGTKYEIFFLNECDHTCHDSDFYLAFDSIKNPKRFNLKLEKLNDNGPTKGLCLAIPTIHKLTDEAPCMAGGFGAGGGFP